MVDTKGVVLLKKRIAKWKCCPFRKGTAETTKVHTNVVPSEKEQQNAQAWNASTQRMS